MAERVIVHTEGAAAYLVECLPDVGLNGTAVDDNTVHIVVPEGESAADVAWMIQDYGDRFRVALVQIDAAETAETCIHCGFELLPRSDRAGESRSHITHLNRCQTSAVPYGHEAHPALPCPDWCLGAQEARVGETCEHLVAPAGSDGPHHA